MRISDWSSDVCSSDLLAQELQSIICEFSRISSPFQDEATVMSKANFFHTAGPSINPRLPSALAQTTHQVGIMTAGKPVCQLPRSSFPGSPSPRRRNLLRRALRRGCSEEDLQGLRRREAVRGTETERG